MIGKKKRNKGEETRSKERKTSAGCPLRRSTLFSHPSGINVVWQWCVRRTWYHGLGICPGNVEASQRNDTITVRDYDARIFLLRDISGVTLRNRLNARLTIHQAECVHEIQTFNACLRCLVFALMFPLFARIYFHYAFPFTIIMHSS